MARLSSRQKGNYTDLLGHSGQNHGTSMALNSDLFTREGGGFCWEPVGAIGFED